MFLQPLVKDRQPSGLRMPYSGALVAKIVVLAFALVLAACGPVQTTPTVQSPGFATPEPLPTRVPRSTATPAAISVALTLTPTPTPTATLTEGPPRAVPSSGRLPGGYVQTARAPLLDSPGGTVLMQLDAGARIGILERNGGWLKVRYQPEPDGKATIGWIDLAQVVVFADLDTLASGTAIPFDESAPVSESQNPVAGETPSAETQETAIVQANRLNLRAGPGTNQRVLASLRNGDQVELVGRTDDASWLEIETGKGERGWVARRYVRTDTVIESLAVTGKSTTGVPAPQVTSAGGRIVFQTRNGGDIYTINANGSGLRRLTRGFDPALSPDGSEVAFTRWDEPRGLWIINIDGSNERHLFTANKPRSPTWTADGSGIIFEHSTGEKRCISTPFGCYTSDELREAFGGKNCVSTPFGRFCISDFPSVTRSLGGLMRYNTNDGSVRDLPAGVDASSPYQDHSSDRVLYLEPQGLAVTRNQGDDPPRRVIELSTIGPGVFSPDGRYIYATRRSGDHWDIWRYNEDGSGEFALTAPPGIRDAPVHSVAPILSPDGRTILFLTNRRGPWELWRMNADGSNARPFAAEALAGIEFQYDFANERMVDWRS